jgi:DNA-binding NarL/FixJ family response regulator
MSSPVAIDIVSSDRPSHSSRVLVVEDSALIRERLVDLIQSFPGARVTAEADAENTALAALHEQTFDAAVVDLQLRQGSGFGVLRALRQLSPQPVTIVLTNSSMRAVRDRCLALGAHYFFDKSNEFDRVAEALEMQPHTPALDARPPPPSLER